MAEIRVLVVDDSAFMRRAITQMLGTDPNIKVVGAARDGAEALARIRDLRPDVVTMDIEMPVLDGLSFLKAMKVELPEPRPAVIVCSSLSKAGSEIALKALSLGASDVVCKPGSQFSLSIGEIQDDLLAKVRALASRSKAAPRRAATPTKLSLRASSFDLLLIGSSTGGPPALEAVVTRLTPGLNMPVVIAQHMPPLFTKSLAERLALIGKVPVHHGQNGMPLQRGMVYIAEGGKHTRVRRSAGGALSLESSLEPLSALYRPSVDELFSSGPKVAGARCLAVILTGMGNDGAVGAAEIRARGGVVISQEAHSCVVYGMPKAVEERGLSSAVATPEQIGTALGAMCGCGHSELCAA